MQPLTVITGILLGSCASIMFGLAVVALVSVIVGQESPRLAAELHDLWRHILLFTVLTALCAAGFVGLVKRHAMRWAAQAAMWAALALTVWFYWPDG